MARQPFDAGTTLAYLDDIATRFGPSGLISTEAAWDAAWLVCVALDPRHEAVAQAALAGVVLEVERLSIASTSAWANAPTALALP